MGMGVGVAGTGVAVSALVLVGLGVTVAANVGLVVGGTGVAVGGGGCSRAQALITKTAKSMASLAQVLCLLNHFISLLLSFALLACQPAAQAE